MAAFMSQDPKASAKEALHEGVETPEDCSDGSRRYILACHKRVEEPKGRCETSQVAEDIAHAADRRALEAVLWYRISDVLDGKIGHFELIPVRVDKLAVFRFGAKCVDGREG